MPGQPPLARGLQLVGTIAMTDAESVSGDLIRSLAALRRAEIAWIDGLDAICAGDPGGLTILRRWREQLAVVALRLTQAESRLLHYLLVPEERRGPWREAAHPEDHPSDKGPGLALRIGAYLRALGVPSCYRRVEDVLDLAGEAVTCDIAIDIAELARVMTMTITALGRIPAREAPTDGDPGVLEDVAFYRVISPWKRRGIPALEDVSRWLGAVLREHEEI